jgi:small-conductance mechanosensitive channel
VAVDFWVWLLTIAGAAVGGGVSATVIASLIARFGRRYGWVRVQAELRLCLRPWVATVTAVAVALAMQQFPAIEVGWRRVAWVPVIVASCWLVIHAARVGESSMFRRLPLVGEQNHRVRRFRTQVAMLRRLIVVTSIVFGVAGAALLLLPGLPAVGASLFASAGLAGIVAGLAAQSTLANVFAGMQLAFTDAVRIEDVVVVEGEWGWIEEITLTYVVLHIWDERRLVLPTSYFTTMPFQNWTRHQCQVLGSVILHLDYATPLTALRAHAQRVIEASPLWDRKDWVLQVTSTTETTMVVRVLASAKDGPTSWDLCCDIREALLVFLQERHPQALPVHRLLNVPSPCTVGEVENREAFTKARDQVDLTRTHPRRAELRRAEKFAGR